MSKTNQNNGPDGIRYVCGVCAEDDGREIVHSFPSKTGGPCRLCGVFIEPGEDCFVLDSGFRGGRKALTNQASEPKPDPAKPWSPYDH